MRLDFFLLADSAEQDEADKITVFGAIITDVEVDRVPTRVSLAAVARLLVDDWDLNAPGPFELVVRFVPPEGEAVRTRPVLIPPSDLPSAIRHPEEERSVIAVAALEGLPIGQLGLHRFELVLNGEVVGRRALTVSLAEGEEDSSQKRKT